MLLRGFVVLIGLIIAIVGISQAIAPGWWLTSLMPIIMGIAVLRVIGIVVIVIGGLLVLAALSRAVGLSLYVLILGLLMLVIGILLLVDPGLIKSGLEAFIVNRGTGLVATRVAGVIRLLLGIALMYAGWPQVVRPVQMRPA